jgi:hypothetical protein
MLFSKYSYIKKMSMVLRDNPPHLPISAFASMMEGGRATAVFVRP